MSSTKNSIFKEIPFPYSSESRLQDRQLRIATDISNLLIKHINIEYNGPKISSDHTMQINTNRLRNLNFSYLYGECIAFDANHASKIRVSIVLEFDPMKPKIDDLFSSSRFANTTISPVLNYDEQMLLKDFELEASKHAIWMEQIDNQNKSIEKIVLYDSWPIHQDVYRYPHHYHVYNSNVASANAFPFNGSFSELIKSISNYIRPSSGAA